MTYVPREHLELEKQIQYWIDGPHTSILSVSGPTKSGKTVLLRQYFDDEIWLSGGAITTIDEFWEQLAAEFNVYTTESDVVTHTSSDSSEAHGGITTLIQAGASKASSEDYGRESARAWTQTPKTAVRTYLLDCLKGTEISAIVIDDFHYIPSDIQLGIVRGLKDLVFKGLPVVFLSVPHRAFDVVRVEKEMTSRVKQIAVEPWEVTDLIEIARKGFDTLSLEPLRIPESGKLEIYRTLADESFSSPHLMQVHCLNLAHLAMKGSFEWRNFDWNRFFRSAATEARNSSFDLLKTGPRQRSDRKERHLKDGGVTDIYGAILLAISHLSPSLEMTYEEIRAALRDILSEDVPQRHEVTNVLEKMTEIARDKIEGEPVLEYDVDYSKLYIADPYFAYYVRWATDEMKDVEHLA